MKKSTLFMACCIGLMLLASCKKETKPTINVVTDPGYVSQSSQVFSGDQLLVGFNVTGESLIQIMMIAEQNGNAIFTHSETLDNVASYSYTKTFSLDATGTVTIRGTVTDAKGNTATNSFDINLNEKPNAKFVGHYDGDILITAKLDANITGMDPVHDSLKNQSFHAIVDITPGESIIEVLADITITINNQESTNRVKGTVEGNKVVFEAIDNTFTYYYSYQGFSIPIPFNMTYAINGTLNGERLDIDGTCKGNGELNLSLVNIHGTVELDGILGGSMNKTR